VVGSGFKNPKRAALKWLNEEIVATKEGRRAVMPEVKNGKN